jgi:hypothetical protein
MPLALLFFAAVAVLAVVAGELGEMPWRRRLADAGRSRTPAAVARPRLRA